MGEVYLYPSSRSAQARGRGLGREQPGPGRRPDLAIPGESFYFLKGDDRLPGFGVEHPVGSAWLIGEGDKRFLTA